MTKKIAAKTVVKKKKKTSSMTVELNPERMIKNFAKVLGIKVKF